MEFYLPFPYIFVLSFKFIFIKTKKELKVISSTKIENLIPYKDKIRLNYYPKILSFQITI